MTAYSPKIALAFSPKVGGESVKSLRLSFENVGCIVGSADYREMMADISEEAFNTAYKTNQGRQRLFAHAKAKAAEFLQDYDCLALSGNVAMLDPNLFQQKRKRHKYDFSRTIVELALVHVASLRGMPIYGVCGGHQVIAVYGGGSLRDLTRRELIHHQDMCYDEVNIHSNSLLHKVLFPKGSSFCILPSIPTGLNNLNLAVGFDSYFIHITGITDKLYYIDVKDASITALTIKDDKQAIFLETILSINQNKPLLKHELDQIESLTEVVISSKHQVFGAHFQAVEQLPAGFKQTAFGRDGKIIEAMESTYGAPIIATQFHPEIMDNGFLKWARKHQGNAEQIGMSKNLFIYLREAAKTYHYKKLTLSGVKEASAINSLHEPLAVNKIKSAKPINNDVKPNIVSSLIFIFCAILSLSLFIAFPPAAISMLSTIIIGGLVGGFTGLIAKTVINIITNNEEIHSDSPESILNQTPARLWDDEPTEPVLISSYAAMLQTTHLNAPIIDDAQTQIDISEENINTTNLVRQTIHPRDESIHNDSPYEHRFA